MSTQTHTCITVTCDGCGRTYKGYEDEYTVHFESIEEFAKEQKEYEGEHNEWTIEGDKHYCDECSCERRDGHALTETIGASRYCKCGKRWERSA